MRSTIAPAANKSEDELALQGRIRLLVELGVELVQRGEVELLAPVEAEIRRLAGDGADDDLTRVDVAIIRAAIRGELSQDAGYTALARLLKIKADPAPRDAVGLADLVLGMTADRKEAERLMSLAPQPIHTTSFDTGDDQSIGPAASLLIQSRNLARLGRPLDAVQAIPDTTDERGRGITLFQRMVVLTGTIWGEALAGKRITADEIVRRLRPALIFFQRPFDETNEWRDWHMIERRAPAFYDAVLRAAHAHGQAALDAILQTLLDDFRRRGNWQRPGWRLSWKRDILLAAFNLDGNRHRTVAGLDQLESEVDVDHELHDRITDRRAHLLARLSLGDRDRAATLLEQMLATSFGVYHGDDDQLTRWSRWAARYSEQAAGADGKAALLQLLRALPVQNRNHRGDDRLEETEILVAAATRLDRAWGYSVANWLLDGGSADRSHVYSGLVGGCLGGAEAETLALAAIVTARLIVPFETSTAAALPSELGAALNGSDSEAVAAACGVLRHCAEIKSLPGNRASWAGPLNLAPALRQPATEGENTPEPSRRKPGLVLSDGSTLTPREVKALASDPKRFWDLLSQATGASGIGWGALLAVVLPAVTDANGLRLLREHMGKLGSSVGADAAFAARAAELGDRGLTAEIQSSMFSRSRRHGWMRRYDGGTRLMYAQSLVTTEGAEGRRKAAELFARDYIEGLTARELLLALDPILAVIFEKVPVAPLWHEFSEHAAQLAEISESSETPPPAAELPHLDGRDVLVRLLFSDLESPAVTVATEARKGLTDLVRLGICLGKIEEEVRTRLRASDAAQMVVASLLMCAIEERPEWVKAFSTDLLGLAWSHSAIVRRLVQQILSQLRVPVPEGPPSRDLPAIFQLHLPEAQMRDRGTRGGAPDRGAPLPDTADPIDLASLFSSPLELISKTGGPSYEALANRLATLMRQLQPAEGWSQEAEKGLRRHLEAIDLKVAFRRPRSLVSLRAFAHLIAELVDGDVLHWPFHIIDEWLLTVDTLLGRLDPTTKPAWLELPSPKTLGEYPVDQWIAKAGDALDLAARATPDGGLVLAEYTLVEGLDQQRPRETRVSTLGHPEFPRRPGREPDLSWFYFRREFVAAEYPQLFGLKPMPVPALAGGPYFADAEFLALNPALASHLGWSPAEDGLFRWVDSSGATMAESIWWQDGNRTALGAHGYEEATAEGWAVVASKAALPALRVPLRNFRRYLSSCRETESRRGASRSNVVDRVEDFEIQA